MAPFTFRSKCNSEVFNEWIEKKLVPKLQPGQVVIMDNAKFYKSEKTKELIEFIFSAFIYQSLSKPLAVAIHEF
ncbi:MAG: transposase [Burkholderiales bacterium]